MIKELLGYLKLFLSIVLTIIVLRYLGFKGVLGILIGFAFMGYLIFSENVLFISFLSMLRTDKNKVKRIKRDWLDK